MNPAAIDDLIQSVLEGDASPSDVTRLEQMIAADPFVRRRHAELQRAFAALAQGAKLEDPPADLRASILEEIRRRQPEVARDTTIRPVSRPAFSWLRLALPLAACAAAAVVLLWNGRANAPHPIADGTTGAIGAVGAVGGVAPQNTLALGQGEQAVSIAWRELPGGRFALDIGAGAVPATLTLSPHGVRLDRPVDAIALEPRSANTILGEIIGEQPSVGVTLTWADGRSESRDIPLGGIRH